MPRRQHYPLTRKLLPVLLAGTTLATLTGCAHPAGDGLPTDAESFGQRLVDVGRLPLPDSGVPVPVFPASRLPVDHIVGGQSITFFDTAGADKLPVGSSGNHGLTAFEADSAAQAVTSFQTMRNGAGWGAVARCDRFVVATSEVTEQQLLELVTHAYPSCAGNLESGMSHSVRNPSAAPAPPPAEPEPSVTTYTPPPKPLPKSYVVSGWDDTATEVPKAFKITGFRVTPTPADGAATMTITVHNLTGRTLSFNPGVTDTDDGGGDYTYGDATSCWPFPPHDTDTVRLQGAGLDPDATFTSRQVESGTC